VSHNHQQVSKARRTTARETAPAGRDDPFSRLVASMAADPANPFNIERYLWVLDEPPARRCSHCGGWFAPGESYDGGPARGRPRRYCSPGCVQRAGWERHWTRHRPTVAGDEWWGSAA
jgi:hypothetical protein